MTAVNLNSATRQEQRRHGNESLTGAVTAPAGTLQISTTGPTVSSCWWPRCTGITAGVW